jgi:VWFA-related protein
MNLKTTASAALLAVVLGGTSSAPTAQSPGSVQSPQPPTFRATTDVVEVDVVVQDKQGHFVTDLSPADFDVSEEGAPQRVSVFYLVESGVTRVADAKLEGNTPFAAASAPAVAPRIFVAYFDDAHLTPAGFKRVQAAALTLFSKEFKDGDMGGVVHNGLMVNSRLTSNRAEILKAVRDAKPNSDANSRLFDQRQWPRMSDVEAVWITMHTDRAVTAEVIARACTDDPSLCQNAELAVRGKAAQLADETRATTARGLQGLLALLNGLTRLPGRKTVLLLSEGFIAEESWPLVQDSVGLAARANARIYTLDARGLDRFGIGERLGASHPSDGGMSSLIAQFDVGADSINSLAIDTGGFVVRNTNVFDAAVKQIADDTGTYYVLGYRPERTADGKYRRLSVKVARPGLVIRARKGYVATPRAVATAAVTEARTAPSPPAATAATGPAARVKSEKPEPAAPEPGAMPPATSDAVVVPAGSTAANSVRLRPNVTMHLNDLAANEGPDKDATIGWEAYQRGDVATARTFLTTAASRRGAQLWVHYALGQSEYALREYSGAVASWERVHGGAPEFEPVYFDLVDGYLQLKEYDKAIRLLRTATELWPRDPEVFNALGVVQTARGSLDDAVKSFGQAIAVAPGEAVGHFNLGKAMELRYYRSRHYVQQLRSWVANENDRSAAVEHYERYLALGGPYADAAREGLTRLNWTPK